MFPIPNESDENRRWRTLKKKNKRWRGTIFENGLIVKGVQKSSISTNWSELCTEHPWFPRADVLTHEFASDAYESSMPKGVSRGDLPLGEVRHLLRMRPQCASGLSVVGPGNAGKNNNGGPDTKQSRFPCAMKLRCCSCS